ATLFPSVVIPGADVLEAALVQASPFGCECESSRGPAAEGQELGHAPLQAPFGIFQRQVEHIALLGLDRAENESVCGASQAKIEGKPGLSELGPRAKQRRAFRWNDVLHNPCERREIHRLQINCRERAALPCSRIDMFCRFRALAALLLDSI